MAVVDVFLAICALKTFGAMTLILIAFYCRALSAVQTRIGIAVLHLQLAISSAISSRTFALKSLTRIAASGTVKTRLAGTCYRLRLAMLSNPTVTTQACVTLIESAGIIRACAIIQTWILAAVFDFNFTVGSDEAGWTFACVGALAGV